MKSLQSHEKTYKALLLDVDGTLIFNKRDASPTKEVIEAVKKAREKIHVGIATARPLSELNAIFSTLPLSGPSVVNGGSQIIDFATKKILKEQALEDNDVIEVWKRAKRYGFDEIIINDDDANLHVTDGYVPKKPFQIYIPSQTEENGKKFLRDISHLTNVSAHLVISWKKDSIDIVATHSLATKQHGVLEVARLLDIETQDIIGVGDGYNDFPLLMACGLKVAMGNAIEDLKEIADYIAPPAKENGVVDVIERFVL